MSTFLPFIIVWVILAVAVIALALMRRTVASHEDDIVHLSGGEAAAKAAQHQIAVAQKLDKIDKWGKTLTIVLAATGILLAGWYGWAAFSSTTGDPFAS
jgi:hypothetical protein